MNPGPVTCRSFGVPNRREIRLVKVLDEVGQLYFHREVSGVYLCKVGLFLGARIERGDERDQSGHENKTCLAKTFKRE